MHHTLGTQLILRTWKTDLMSCPDGQLVTTGRLFLRKRWTRWMDFESSIDPASIVIVMSWQPYHTHRIAFDPIQTVADAAPSNRTASLVQRSSSDIDRC